MSIFRREASSNVSMTDAARRRQASRSLIRAASSQTLGSNRRQRVMRLPTAWRRSDGRSNSLIVKQTGVNTNANANGNPVSAEDGSDGGDMAIRARRERMGWFERCFVSARRWSRSQFLAAARAPMGRSLASGR